MPTILAAILPVFALIGAGYVFGRGRRIGPDGIAALNGFTVWMALPALLFRALAERGVAPPGSGSFTWPYVLGMAATFVLGLAVARPERGSDAPLADRAVAALASAYPNIAFIGIPLAQGLLGDTGLQSALLASLFTISALFAVALLVVEIGLKAGGGLLQSAGKVVAALLRNPLVLSPLAGLAWHVAGWPLPTLLARFIDLLAVAASPCALATIGAFLALPGRPVAPTRLAPAMILKLVLQPALTAALAFWLLPALGLSFGRDWAVAAVLIAALPTGTGAFMLAELYEREAALASRGILLTTAASLVTVTALALLLVR